MVGIKPKINLIKPISKCIATQKRMLPMAKAQTSDGKKLIAFTNNEMVSTKEGAKLSDTGINAIIPCAIKKNGEHINSIIILQHLQNFQ